MEKKRVTPSGATLFFHENNQLHSFCLCLYVKAGTMYEEELENGISHFFEHIVFRNIHFHRGQNLYQTLDRLGLSFNATTYNELIRFSISGAPMHFAQAAEILTQIFEPISLPEEEIDLERRRVLAEIREEKEDDCVAWKARKVSWKGTSLARTIIGKKKILKEIHGEQLQAFQNKILREGSFFFYVTGKVPQDAETILTNYIEKYKVKSHFPENWDNIAPIPDTFFHREAEVYLKKGDHTEVFFGFDLDVTRYTVAEIDLLYDVLFRGDYCRMYQELSEKKGYVYSYDPGSEQYANIGQMKFMYEVQMKNLVASIQTVIEIFQNLKKDIGDALDYVKPNYIDNAYSVLDNPDDFNWIQSYEDKILKNPYRNMEERIEAYQKVTPERMTQICQEIFRLENMVVAVSGDKKKIPCEDILTILKSI